MTKLIEEKTVPFDPYRYQDFYPEQIEAVLRGRLKERETADSEIKRRAMASSELLDFLRRSLHPGRKRAA